MSTLRENRLRELVQDFVRQHRLHVRVADLSTWEHFRRETGISMSPSELQEFYREECLQDGDYTPPSGSGDLQEGVHYDWVNDAREGLKKSGVPVVRDISLIRHLLNAPGQFPSLDSSIGSSDTDTQSVDSQMSGSRMASRSKPRSKKRQITNHERFMRIKRNLDKAQKKRRLSQRASPQRS